MTVHLWTRLQKRVVATALFSFVLLLSAPALADKVAVLPFISVGNATSAELDDAQKATRAAVTSLAHKLPSDAEMLTAKMSTKDGVADTSQEYRAAGRASGSDWTVVGKVEQHGATYRLELEACQVDSGRVESLAREIDPPAATKEVGEMLAILIRKEGIGNADIPWEHAAPAPPTPPVPPTPVVVEPPPPVVPPPPPPPPPVRHAYAEGHPLAVGAGVGVLGAVHRSERAVGNSTALLVSGAFAYAIDAVPGFEVRANIAGAALGPQSLSLDAGARYAIPVVPSARLFAGPEITLGGFFTLGGEKTGRFLLHNAVFASLGIGERVAVEAAFDLEYAPGGSSALLLAGGTARALFRF